MTYLAYYILYSGVDAVIEFVRFDGDFDVVDGIELVLDEVDRVGFPIVCRLKDVRINSDGDQQEDPNMMNSRDGK